MGHIKEPANINFVVDPTPLTLEDRMRISEIIAHYKATGRKKVMVEPPMRKRVIRKRKTVA